MPTPEARAAFAEAQHAAEEMRHVHSQEQAIEGVKARTTDVDLLVELDRELVNLRNEWLRLSTEYTDAIGRFTKATDDARRAGQTGNDRY